MKRDKWHETLSIDVSPCLASALNKSTNQRINKSTPETKLICSLLICWCSLENDSWQLTWNLGYRRQPLTCVSLKQINKSTHQQINPRNKVDLLICWFVDAGALESHSWHETFSIGVSPCLASALNKSTNQRINKSTPDKKVDLLICLFVDADAFESHNWQLTWNLGHWRQPLSRVRPKQINKSTDQQINSL